MQQNITVQAKIHKHKNSDSNSIILFANRKDCGFADFP